MTPKATTRISRITRERRGSTCWCSSGRPIASFPEVVKYAKQYADKLSVVGVMLSDNHAGWLEMYQYRKPFEWPNLSDGKQLDQGAAVPYGIGLYPTFVLVEPAEGKIVRIWSGFKLDKFQAEMQPYFAPVQ